MKHLSAETIRRVELLFSEKDRPDVIKLLMERCSNNLPFLENATSVALERFQFAALKLSNGRLEGLERAIHIAEIDWRDLLVAAGFGWSVTAHLHWLSAK